MFFKYFQGKFNFQGLFKTVLYIQVLFKSVRTLCYSNCINGSSSCHPIKLSFACWVIFLKPLFSFANFFFSKLTFSEISFRNNIKGVKWVESRLGPTFFSPDLGPNCLQRLSTDDKVAANKKIVYQR